MDIHVMVTWKLSMKPSVLDSLSASRFGFQYARRHFGGKERRGDNMQKVIREGTSVLHIRRVVPHCDTHKQWAPYRINKYLE